MHGFRSEEFGWKENVHLAQPTIENDRAAAYAALTVDDGFSLGILFRDHHTSIAMGSSSLSSLSDLEFRVSGV